MHDKDIVKLFFSRDEHAITAVSNKYGAYCYSVAINIVTQHEDAEECVNDTWLSAWNCMPPQKPDILKYFLAKITRSKAIDRLKMIRCPLSSGSLLSPYGGVPPQNLPCLERVMIPASTFLEISRLYISFKMFLNGVISIC